MRVSAWLLCIGVVIVVGLVITNAPAIAHHSSAPFYDDTKRVDVIGVVQRFVFRNPHSFLYVEAPGENGETVEWEIEMGASVSMSRRGWTPETIKVGDDIKVAVNHHAHPAPRASAARS